MALTPGPQARGDTGPVRVETSPESAYRRPSRAVRRSGHSRAPRAFGVQPDRFDHEVEFVGAVDLARYAVGHIGPDELGFGEVIEPVNALRVEVPQQEHRARRILRP